MRYAVAYADAPCAEMSVQQLRSCNNVHLLKACTAFSAVIMVQQIAKLLFI